MINRERYYKASPENSLAGARAFEALVRQRLARGEPIEGRKQEVKIFKKYREFSKEWFDRYVKINNKPSEIRSKQSILKVHLLPFFGNKKLNEINNYEIEKFKAKKIKRKLNPKSINNLLCVLSKSLSTAEDWQLIDKKPKIKRLTVPQQKFDYLSVEESEHIIRHSDGLLKDLIIMALHTGLRFGELIALTWKDVNFKENVLTVSKAVSRGKLGSTKNNKIRYIPINKEVMTMLESRKSLNNKSKLIFPNKFGKFLIQERCRGWLHDICKKARLRKIGWHTFRHTFASRLAENGISMRTIQELLGHSDTNTTMRYAHLSPVVLREAIKTLEKPIDLKIWYNIGTNEKIDHEFETCLIPQHQNSLGKTQKSDVNPISE